MKRKIISIAFLCMALLSVGCGKNEVSESNSENTTENRVTISKKLKKIKIENLSMKISDKWEDMSVENMLLYKIDEYDNFSIVTDATKIDNIDEYVQNAKKELDDVIDLSDVTIEKEMFNGYEARTMKYNYDVEGTDVEVYQICFIHEGLAYILTLCSEEDNIDNNIEILKENLETLKIK